jgi:hypothetical protein
MFRAAVKPSVAAADKTSVFCTPRHMTSRARLENWRDGRERLESNIRRNSRPQRLRFRTNNEASDQKCFSASYLHCVNRLCADVAAFCGHLETQYGKVAV